MKILYLVVVLGVLSGSTIFFWWNDPPTMPIPGHNYGEQTVIGTIIVAVLTLIVVRALRPR
jgi:hypothetical protein